MLTSKEKISQAIIITSLWLMIEKDSFFFYALLKSTVISFPKSFASLKYQKVFFFSKSAYTTVTQKIDSLNKKKFYSYFFLNHYLHL